MKSIIVGVYSCQSLTKLLEMNSIDSECLFHEVWAELSQSSMQVYIKSFSRLLPSTLYQVFFKTYFFNVFFKSFSRLISSTSHQVFFKTYFFNITSSLFQDFFLQHRIFNWQFSGMSIRYDIFSIFNYFTTSTLISPTFHIFSSNILQYLRHLSFTQFHFSSLNCNINASCISRNLDLDIDDYIGIMFV